MRPWVGKTVKLVSAATLIHACAGKSISRSGDDSDTPDDGVGNGGSANAGYGGKGGMGTVGKGGSPGNGGKGGGTGGTSVPRGGTAGRGGTSGFGGTSGRGGTGGNAGETDAGFGGWDGCEPRRSGGAMHTTCAVTPGCISPNHPTIEHVLRNEPVDAPGYGGEGGEGGGGVDDSDWVASADVCSDESGRGYLAFDYFNPHRGVAVPGFLLTSGHQLCGGYSILNATFADYDVPPPGTWTTQCIEVDDIDSASTVTIDVYTGRNPMARVRNVRFVSSCSCPRQVTRFTTCGDIASPRACQ